MKSNQKGFVVPIVIAIIALLVVGVGLYISIQKNKVIIPLDNINPTANSLSDAQFISATSDPEGKVLARGDINDDGFEDAIVQTIHCGASCSVGLEVVFNIQNTSTQLFQPTQYETFGPAYVGSSAAKSQITNIFVKDGIISLIGYGLDCGGDKTKDTDICTSEKWHVAKTITYKYDGKNMNQLSVSILPVQSSGAKSDTVTDNKFISKFFGITFEYPKVLAVSETSSEIKIYHSIPYENYGCDLKGDGIKNKNLSDFDVNISVSNMPIVDTIKTDSKWIPAENFKDGKIVVTPGFIDAYDNGYSIYIGAEGCGYTKYYILLKTNKTLIIKRAQVQEFSGALVPEVKKTVLSVEGVIPPEKADLYLKGIISSIINSQK